MEHSIRTEAAIRTWLEDVVMGLNLCPFAKLPYDQERVKIVVCEKTDLDEIFAVCYQELSILERLDPSELETTILAIPHGLKCFDDYLDALDVLNYMISEWGWEGTFQVASFHPDYVFEGEGDSDRSHYTNRSPCPVFHFIRELSLTNALANYPSPELIPERNKKKMRSLTQADIERLFRST